MPRDDSYIPAINLPRLGSGASEHSDEQGSVRAPDRHHDRFVNFVSSGEGLDNLVAGIESDIVGADGRTAAQRDDEAEAARQESVVRKYASEPPPAASPASGGFFDDDLTGPTPLRGPGAECGGGVPEVDRGATGGAPQVPDAGRGQSPPPAADPEADGVVENHGAAQASVSPPLMDPAASSPAADLTAPPAPAANRSGDSDVPPPGSLWDITHDAQSAYDPGPIISDPGPVRPPPGPVVLRLRRLYRRWWLPLGRVQKIVAVAVTAALAIWGTYLVVGHGSDGSAPVVEAEPIVDGGPAPEPEEPGPLPPTSVEAPGCPARSQPPANAFDGKPETAWVCLRAFGTDLQTIIVKYDQPVVVSSIFVVPGFECVDNGRNLWNQHRIVTLIMWRIGGQSFRQVIDPNAHTGATLQIPNVATQVITGKVFQTAAPPVAEDDSGPGDVDVNATIAIPTITINGYQAGGPRRH